MLHRAHHALTVAVQGTLLCLFGQTAGVARTFLQQCAQCPPNSECRCFSSSTAAPSGISTCHAKPPSLQVCAREQGVSRGFALRAVGSGSVMMLGRWYSHTRNLRCMNAEGACVRLTQGCCRRLHRGCAASGPLGTVQAVQAGS